MDRSVQHLEDGIVRRVVALGPSHSLPRVDDMLDALAGASWFSTLNFCHGYWQVELAQEDREKTAFTTGQGLHQFNAHCVHMWQLRSSS